jgi:hypothetical protein
MRRSKFMVSEWSLRDEVLETSHRWPLILLFCLVGAALGWLVSQVLPSPYRAKEDLHVILNIYRWEYDQNVLRFTGDVSFNHPDDYKNWQMANLNVLVLRGDLAGEVLQRLQAQDPAWNLVDLEELQSMMDVYWRNAGRWTLVVDHPDPQMAAEAVRMWKAVVLEWIRAAIDSSVNTIELEMAMQKLAGEVSEAVDREGVLQSIQTSLEEWRAENEGLPGSEALAETELAYLSGLAAQAPDTLTASLPAPDSQRSAYLNWVDQAWAALAGSQQVLEGRLAALHSEQDRLAGEYEAASKASLGFSPNLEVTPVSETAPASSPIRPTATLVFVGGLIGLRAWVALWLVQITTKARA